MLEAKPQDAGLAFMLAIHLQDKELMETTAKRAVRMSDHEIADLALGQEWKQRLVSLTSGFPPVSLTLTPTVE